jgi:site-specific DNA-cytosine methylase
VRFCPFCSAENADESMVCGTCGRRLPPLPPRRRNAPPTGVQLPPNRQKPASNPPPVPQRSGNTQPPPLQSPAPMQPPAPMQSPASALLNAISPGPAAQRREAPPPDDRDPAGRRKSDLSPPPTPAARSKPLTNPPSIPKITKPSTPAMRPPAAGFDDDFNTMPSASAYESGGSTVVSPPPAVESEPAAPPRSSFSSPSPFSKPAAPRTPLPPPVSTEPTYPVHTPEPVAGPPPTRIHRPEQLADRPFTPPKVDPIPEIPEPGLISAAKYSVRFWQAKIQRRGAIKTLGADIKQDTEALDQVLGALGRAARGAKVDGRVFSAENQAISAAEERAFMLGQEHGDVDGRKAEENSKFLDVEKERNQKLDEAQRAVDETQKELAQLEGQRRALRDKRKELERRQKAYLKGAEDAERQAGNAQMGDQRQDLRRSAEQFRKEAGLLDPERQDMDRKLGALERPINEATARLDAAKAELDAAKRSLADAREGHNHRLAELDAEQKRKSREIGLAEAEISRRLVTLGTLVNLNRIEDAQFHELYQRIDRLRGAITARTTEIEKLTAEREAYDRGTMVRGYATIGGAFVAFIALIVILRAIL